MIEYLVAYCMEQGKSSLDYMNAVAIAWAKKKITSVEDAKLESAPFTRECRLVQRELGLGGEAITPAQMNFIQRWFQEWGFSDEMITQACQRTVIRTGKSSFPYADKILRGWHERGISDPMQLPADDAKRDADYKARYKTLSAASAKVPAKDPVHAGSSFHNFTERKYDIDAIESQLLKKGFQ